MSSESDVQKLVLEMIARRGRCYVEDNQHYLIIYMPATLPTACLLAYDSRKTSVILLPRLILDWRHCTARHSVS